MGKKTARQPDKAKLRSDLGSALFSPSSVLSLSGAIIFTIASVFLFSQFEFLRQFGYLGVFLISLISSATVFLPVPGFAVVFAMGAYLNPLLLGVAAGIGSGIGEITGYMAGYAGHGAIERSQIYRSHKKQIEKYGAPAIFILALIPNPLFDLAGIASGALEMPIWKFLLATIAGKIIRFVGIAYAGGIASGWLM